MGNQKPTKREIQEFHKDRFIQTKFVEDAFSEIDFIFTMAEMKKKRPYNLMIVGDSGAGKTALLNEYFRTRPFAMERADDGILKTKYIAIDMPVSTTGKRLLTELIRASGGHAGTRALTSELETSFDILAKNIELKAIVIDEFHNLLGSQKNNLVNCLNQLKRLTTNLGLSLIIAGTPQIIRILEFDDQFAKRLNRIVLPNWSETVEFKEFVVRYLSSLPIDLPHSLPSAIFSELLNGPSNRTYDVVRILIQSALEANNKADIINLDKYIQDCAKRTAHVVM